MEVSDNLFVGPDGPNSFSVSSVGDPTRQSGVGPLGLVVFRGRQPAALAAANIAALQAPASGAGLTLVAGAGITLSRDPSNNIIFVLDTPRCVSLTSVSNLSAINFLITGYDEFGQRMSQLQTGPNANTVNTLKAFTSLLSVVPTGTSANTVSVGTADVFGLNYRITDAGDIISAKWAGVLAQNAGTLTVADQTNPATATTGDVRGTFAQSGAASNGVLKLVICMHLDTTQVGPNATRAAALGVTQA